MKKLLCVIATAFFMTACGGGGGASGDYNGYYYITSTSGDCSGAQDSLSFRGVDTNEEVNVYSSADPENESLQFRYVKSTTTCVDPSVFVDGSPQACGSCVVNSDRSEFTVVDCPIVEGGSPCTATFKKCTSGFCGTYDYEPSEGSCGGMTPGSLYFADTGTEFGGNVDNVALEVSYDASHACDAYLTVEGAQIACSDCTIPNNVPFGESVQVTCNSCILDLTKE